MRKRIIVMALVMVLGPTVVLEQAFSAGEIKSLSPVLDRIVAKKELVVGTAASMPPLNMTTKDGQIIGIEADLARYFANGMGVKLTLKPMRFNELLTALGKGQVDMVLSGMTITPQRNISVAFAGPYFASGKSVLTKQSKVELVDEIEKMNSPDKTLVALKGSTSQTFVEKLMPKAKLVLSEDYDKAVAIIKNDGAIAMVADYPICFLSVQRYPEAGLATLTKPISYEPIGVALPANDLLLLNWVQNVLNFLERTGELESLNQRWFKDTSWIGQLP